MTNWAIAVPYFTQIREKFFADIALTAWIEQLCAELIATGVAAKDGLDIVNARGAQLHTHSGIGYGHGGRVVAAHPSARHCGTPKRKKPAFTHAGLLFQYTGSNQCKSMAQKKTPG